MLNKIKTVVVTTTDLGCSIDSRNGLYFRQLRCGISQSSSGAVLIADQHSTSVVLFGGRSRQYTQVSRNVWQLIRNILI
jgi:hypothetical protein